MKTELVIINKLELWARENPRIDSLLKSEYGTLLIWAYETLDTSALYRSRVHGAGHIERVMLLGAMIAQALSLSMHESRMLLLCCSYHDIGRSNDWYDEEHGNVSAKKLMAPQLKRRFSGYSTEDFTIIQAAITAHSKRDKDMESVAQSYGITAGCMDRFLRIARCLKDADNLDRVRIKDLDTKHLRHSESVGMVSDAKWIFEQYRKAE